MSSTGKQYNFWNLINNYKIVVPKIQRDYVQGRENDTVKKNREEFVEELIGSLSGNKPMSLNFVYGTIHGNEFIPIDGQQRLTTLFLLHLYVFAKKGNKDEIEVLQKKFSYQTRYTTNRFLEKLSEELPEMLNPSDRNGNDNLTDIIRDSGWYVTPWDNDPNIRSCLVMLQTIHETCIDILANNNDGISKFFNLLTSVDCPITFMWLQLPSSFGSDNQLYIRMNSRGKQLTDFENFKAELYEKILKSDENDSAGKINDFKKNIDGDWYSLFWDAELCRETSDKNQDTLVKNKDEENIEKRATLVDRLLQHIFHWTIVSLICKDTDDLTSTSKNSTKEFERRLYSDLQPGCEIERVYIQEYLELYQNWKGNEDKDDLKNEERERREKERKAAFFKNIIEDFAYTLTFLILLNKEKEEVFRFIINDIFQINYGKKDSINFTIRQYSARVLLYSITKFAKDYKMDEKNDKIEAFKSWYRVVLNLISTQEIDSPEDFQSAVKALEGCDFNRDSNDIDESIKCWLKKLLKEWEDNSQMKRAFRSAQVKEEILKLELVKNCNCESVIRDAENTNFDQKYEPRDYFRGQIWFLLYMAGVKENNVADLNQKNIEDFKYYSQAVRCIFNYDNYWIDWKSDEITNKPKRVDEIKSAPKCSFDNLFHRAMLIYGNYWVNAPGNNIKTFFVYNESHNNYDWRGAFRQKDDGKWGTAVDCLKDLLDNYIPKNPDEYNQKYEFNFEHFKDYLVGLIKAWPAGQIGNSNVNETAKERLRNLLIREPNCFKYIRNNYYIYWGDKDQPPKYLLMQLKRQRAGSIINITNELTKGQTP